MNYISRSKCEYIVNLSYDLSVNLNVSSAAPRSRIRAGTPVKLPMSPAKQKRTITSMFGVS